MRGDQEQIQRKIQESYSDALELYQHVCTTLASLQTSLRDAESLKELRIKEYLDSEEGSSNYVYPRDWTKASVEGLLLHWKRKETEISAQIESHTSEDTQGDPEFLLLKELDPRQMQELCDCVCLIDEYHDIRAHSSVWKSVAQCTANGGGSPVFIDLYKKEAVRIADMLLKITCDGPTQSSVYLSEDDANDADVELVTPSVVISSMLPEMRRYIMKNAETASHMRSLKERISLHKAAAASLRERITQHEESLKGKERVSRQHSDMCDLLSALQYTSSMKVVIKREEAFRKDLQNLNLKLSRASTIKELLTKASHQALEKLVSHINSNVNHLLSNHISRDYSVELCLERALKDTKESLTFMGGSITKYEVTVNVKMSGRNVGQLKNLSGSEYEKVRMLFNVAMSKLLGLKLLIVDESMSTLDSSSLDVILDTIKSLDLGLVIMVNHRHSTGRYDSTVDVKDICS